MSTRLRVYVACGVVGALVGVVYAFLVSGAEWLFDLRRGVCLSRHAWFTPHRLCCLAYTAPRSPQHPAGAAGAPECPWFAWSELGVGVDLAVFTALSVAFAVFSAWLVRTYAPEARGSGIAEVKVIMSGSPLLNVLSPRTLCTKLLGLVFAVGSGLVVGTQGPLVYVACCVAAMLLTAMPLAGRRRHSSSPSSPPSSVSTGGAGFAGDGSNSSMVVMSAATAAGLAAAFGSPIGGVLFSVEQTSSRYPQQTLWLSFFCASVTSVTMLVVDPTHTGKLVMFDVNPMGLGFDLDVDAGADGADGGGVGAGGVGGVGAGGGELGHNALQDALGLLPLPEDSVLSSVLQLSTTHAVDFVAVTLVAVVGGVVGGWLVRQTTTLARWRARNTKTLPVAEVAVVALLTALVQFPVSCLRASQFTLLSSLFNAHHVVAAATAGSDVDLAACVGAAPTLRTLGLLLGSSFAKLVLFMLTHSLAIPAGVFIPAMVVGALFGRALAVAVVLCGVPVANATLYTVVGACAFLVGLTRMTVSMVVVMFELTGSAAYILPVMWCVVVAKTVAGRLSAASIFEAQISQAGHPFVNTTTPLRPDTTAEDVMRTHGFVVLDVDGGSLQLMADKLENTTHMGFPVVSSNDGVLLCHGHVPRARLEAALIKAKRKKLPLSTPCFFSSAERVPRARTELHFDLTPYLDPAPVQVVRHTPLESVVELFTQLDLKYCLVTHEGGLVGLITKEELGDHVERFARHRMRPVRESDWT